MLCPWPPYGGSIMKWRVGICLFVRLSVCRTRVSLPNLRTESHHERPRKPKIGRIEARRTGNPWSYLFRGQRVKGQGYRSAKALLPAAANRYVRGRILEQPRLTAMLFRWTPSYSRIRLDHSCSVRIKRIVRSLNNSRIVTNCLTRTNFRFLLYSEWTFKISYY